MTEIADWRPGLRLLRAALRGTRAPVLRVAAWSAVEAAPALASGWVLGRALDQGFLDGRPATGLAWLTLLGVLYALRAAAERAVFEPLSHIVEPLRDELVRRLVHGTLYAAVHRVRTADATDVARLTGQVEAVRGIVGALLRTARPLAVTLVAALTGLAVLDPLLAALVGVPLAVAVVVFLVSMRTVIRRRQSYLAAEERVAAVTGEVLAAGRDITALGAEERAASDVRDAADASVATALAVARASAVRAPVVLLGGRLPVLLILLTGPALVQRGGVSAGAVVGAVMYVTVYLVPALELMTGSVAGYWSQLRVLSGRLAAASDVPDVPGVSNDPVPVPAPVSVSVSVSVSAQDVVAEVPREGDLEVRNLTFAYGPHAAPVLRGLDLVVPSGDNLAIVGPSGIGKSTLAGLLAGVETPLDGTVTMAGQPVRPGRVALLPQEAYVFPGTVGDNLRYLAPDLDTAALDRAVAAVGARELVARLGGYDAELTDPAGTLSSGERQLIALARVYASPARVVVLDEATSHLDMAAEAVAETAFAARPGTLVVIAHRLTTAARARRVLLLDGERPVLGSHAELSATSPAYAALVGHWTAQAPRVPQGSRAGRP
ncbi:ABC transporter ATP-binding protein [Streptomyces sparsogenes]|uniref:ABC transporter n=1 Tax=Streptomyces sparsogenes DSM 40356 TaxID=1331668 RepID=A0A1R1SNN7_9ACTN|nr:ABC transporter ATP-binding protein [Streptomyces sparsogenes]OMI39931.1 ABC transporter [Streptomyces sparsogenes DSM 40356]